MRVGGNQREEFGFKARPIFDDLDIFNLQLLETTVQCN